MFCDEVEARAWQSGRGGGRAARGNAFFPARHFVSEATGGVDVWANSRRFLFSGVSGKEFFHVRREPSKPGERRPSVFAEFTSSCLVSLCFPFATQGYCTKGGVARLPSADFAFAKASTRLSEKDDHRHLTPVTPRGLLPNHPQTGPDPEPPECRPVATSGGRTHIK